MKGRESSVGGRVTSKAIGNGGGCSNRMGWLGLLSQDPSHQGPGQGEVTTTPGRGPGRAGMEEEPVGGAVGL